MYSKQTVVKNPTGLHARPAAEFSKKAASYRSDIRIKNLSSKQEYIKNQLQEDITADQLTLKEYIDPFTGEPVNVGKK